ncbi:MAG: YebC/PmpR family DNA-binding transcriptional regulator [Chloroflexi bacterium]|nr:YebC/PmpR family DNA-binding transcriptional regulator [Chloroflexota bacterium]MDA8189375.1 YebC/PmpR family DNA-binding transcriptional regulator [Dehalococcoidales bacterium]
MSGHSKWAQIKRQKGANDAKRGQLFTKLGREIMVAAREGGGDPDANFRLRLAVQRARAENMPMENIERAIKRATGGADGAVLEEIVYEGYGPGGAAIMVEAMTDNRNRTVSEIRNVFTRNGGSLGESGCVAWLFEPRGVISIDASGTDPDELALIAIDAGAEDVKTDGDTVEVYTSPAELEAVRDELRERKINVVAAESSMIPKSTLALDEAEALKTLKLMDRLEELDDVQRVYTNVDFSEDLLERYA